MFEQCEPYHGFASRFTRARDEFSDAPDHVVSITAVTNDATMQTIAAQVEAYQKRALPMPSLSRT
jgi:hypothetical protein